MDAVQFVNHRFLKWIQYNSYKKGFLYECSTIREPQVF